MRTPHGIEYKELSVAQPVVVNGTGGLKLDSKNTHSRLTEIEYTNEGLQA